MHRTTWKDVKKAANNRRSLEKCHSGPVLYLERRELSKLSVFNKLLIMIQ